MKYMELNEGKQHGNSAFPVQLYRLDSRHPQFHMVAHWHREFEVLRVLEGDFLAHLDDKEFYLHTGDVLFFAGGTVHHGTPMGEDCRYECLVFDAEMLRRTRGDTTDAYLRPLIHRHRTVTPLFEANDAVFSEAFHRLFDAAGADAPGAELFVFGALYSLFALFYKEGRILDVERGLQGRTQSRTAARLLDYIEENLHSPIDLADLSRVSGLDTRYLCRFFRAYTTRTPIDYINLRRIELAAGELRAIEKSVTEVALDCGFFDVSYFSRVFKKYMGLSPTEYKANKKRA